MESGKQAIAKINALRPDLLFLDIQMPDLNGFEVRSQLDYHPFVIFTTAYEKYTVQAFEAYSVNDLVKPIEVPRFEKAIMKLEKFGNPGPPPDFEIIFTKINAEKKAIHSP